MYIEPCRRWECEYYGELDDGETDDGYPYPLVSWCNYCAPGTALNEEWIGEQECIGKFKPRKENS